MQQMMKRALLVTALLITAAPTANAALMINVQTDGSFNANQLAVINQARADWLALLTFNGGDHTITMNFSTDNAMDDLGFTSNWNWDGNGRVTTVDVAIRTADHNWTLGAPAAMMDDALDTVRHEIGHALGFTVLVPNFNANVITVSGNRFYDLDSDGTFSMGDFDLIDDAGMGTHAPAGSGDLMQPTTPQGDRNAPTVHHAMVLADAYGFRVVPGPSALAIAGLLLVFGSRRRRAIRT